MIVIFGEISRNQMKYTTLFMVALTVELLSSFNAISQIQLEGLYATSTSLPSNEFAVENVFDQNPNTIWKTPKGLGPNEGIMIYFSEPVFIYKIEADLFAGEGVAEITSIEVYGDGMSFGGGYIEREVSFLYIKIAGTDESNRIKYTVDEANYVREKFSEVHSVGIKELSILKDKSTQYKVLTPKFVNGLISASSSLEPALAYGPSNLMDSKKDFGWAENVKGNGIGETITFTTNDNVRITRLKMWNGYQRSPIHFASNSRLRTFQFGVKGDVLQRYTLTDSSDDQWIELKEPIEGTEFILKVVDAYSGRKYEDLVISEIKFYDEKTPLIIKTGAEEDRVKEMRSKSLFIRSFLDKNHSVSMRKLSKGESDEGSYSERKWESYSLTLRSNNSFVLYSSESLSIKEYNNETKNNSYESDSKEVIADGSWELKEEADGYIKIRIFGKIYSPTTSAELYHGDVESDNVRIFQDMLTLKKDKISGEKYVGDIILKD